MKRIYSVCDYGHSNVLVCVYILRIMPNHRLRQNNNNQNEVERWWYYLHTFPKDFWDINFSKQYFVVVLLPCDTTLVGFHLVPHFTTLKLIFTYGRVRYSPLVRTYAAAPSCLTQAPPSVALRWKNHSEVNLVICCSVWWHHCLFEVQRVVFFRWPF